MWHLLLLSYLGIGLMLMLLGVSLILRGAELEDHFSRLRTRLGPVLFWTLYFFALLVGWPAMLAYNDRRK